jgi:hypothetical protein
MKNEPNKWELDDKEQARLVSDYIRDRIKNSDIWHEAVSGGWSTSIYRYVHCVATIQAQRIMGKKDIGYNIIDTLGSRATEQEVKSFLDAQCQKADRGFIDVAIPTARMSYWKSNRIAA